MWLLTCYSKLIEIITPFVLAFPMLSIYLMGSVISFGIYYSLTSTGMIKPSKKGLVNKRTTYLYAFLSSWLLVIVFLFSILRGFFGIIFEKNNNGGY